MVRQQLNLGILNIRINYLEILPLFIIILCFTWLKITYTIRLIDSNTYGILPFIL